MKFHATRCPACGSAGNFEVLYPQNFKPSQVTVDVFSARRLPDKLHYRLVRCKKDGMVRSNPILAMKDLQSLYVESKFTYTGEVENLTTTYFNAVRPVLQQLKKTDPILEIGCGNGFILEKLFKAGYKNVTGVEPSTEAVKHAPKSIRKKIITDIFRRKLFPKNTFSFIFIFQTLDHIPEPEVFLADCVRALKPGGFLLSFHHNIDSLSSKLVGEKSPIIDVEHTQLFSMETSQLMFESVGLEVISSYSPWSQLSVKHLAWLFPFPKGLKEKLLASNSSIGKLLASAKVAVKLGNVCIVGRKSLAKNSRTGKL
jgi:SAM-dependent methyltransferase